MLQFARVMIVGSQQADEVRNAGWNLESASVWSCVGQASTVADVAPVFRRLREGLQVGGQGCPSAKVMVDEKTVSNRCCCSTLLQDLIAAKPDSPGAKLDEVTN